MGSQPLAVCKCGAMTCGAPSPTRQIGQPSACAAGLTDTAASTCASALSSEASNPTPHWARSAAGNRATVTAWGDPCITRLVVCCDDCNTDHYHDWDMLRANLLQLLVDGTVRPHEPAFDPEPDTYVTWDYCRGYADAALNEATSDYYDGLR